MCSIEALFTRIAKGKGMPHINPVVDLGNAVSLKYTLPMGAHDLKDVTEGISVRMSHAGDTFLPFGGTEEEILDDGEVVYAAGSQIVLAVGHGVRVNTGKLSGNILCIFPH